MPLPSAVIPAKNEAATIGDVVRAVLRSGLCGEAIVVSDGSSDDTAHEAEAAGARVLKSEISRGKGAAMLRGAKEAVGDIILFLDGDLIGVRKQFIEDLLEPVQKGTVDMSVGYKDRGRWNIFARHPLIAGQRAMKRELFLALPEKYIQGYSVEVAMNYFVKSRKGKILPLCLSGLDFRKKIDKVGFWRGLGQYLIMSFMVARGWFSIRWGKLKNEF